MRVFLPILILFVLLGFISYKVSFAFFTSEASSTGNTFTAAAIFGTPTPTDGEQPSGSIVINEVSPAGGIEDDWIELYNPSGSPIDVTGWTITDNGGSDTLPSSTIPAGGYAVIIASGSAVAVPGSALTIQISNSTIGGAGGIAATGDQMLLENSSGDDIDSVSWGTNTAFFSIPGTIDSGNSFARQSNGVDTNTAADWIEEAQTLGVAN